MTGRGYMGGGSIAAALGLSPFATPLDAYCEITGEMPMGMPQERREFFDRRKAWEPTARDIFERKTGETITRFNHRYRDATLAWAAAEIDFEVDDINGEQKTMQWNMRKQWDDPMVGEPPNYVMAQVAWGWGVTQRQRAYVHALDLDDDLIYLLDRDEETVLIVRDGAMRFWTNHVEKRRPPLPQDHDDIVRLYGRGTERSVEATDEIMEAIKARRTAKQSIVLAEADQAKADLAIKQYMRDAGVLTVRGQAVITFKTDARGIRSLRDK